MRNRMYFKGGDNTAQRVVVTRLPNIPSAEEDGEWVTIPGADGERFVPNGALKSVSFPVPIWVPPDADLNAVTAWLSREGNLRFNDWGWFWKARVDGQVDFAPCTFNDGWVATVLFKAKPHRYVWPEADVIVATSGTSVPGRGSAPARPLIEISGSGNVTVMIGGSTVMIDDLDGSVMLDCEAKIAYSGPILMTEITSIVDGIWPTLDPDSTLISWTGNVDSVKITPRWRYR